MVKKYDIRKWLNRCVSKWECYGSAGICNPCLHRIIAGSQIQPEQIIILITHENSHSLIFSPYYLRYIF